MVLHVKATLNGYLIYRKNSASYLPHTSLRINCYDTNIALRDSCQEINVALSSDQTINSYSEISYAPRILFALFNRVWENQ